MTNCMQFACKNNSRLGKAILFFEGWLTRKSEKYNSNTKVLEIRYSQIPPRLPYPTPCVKEPPPSPACQIATKKAARNKRSLPSPPVISTTDTGLACEWQTDFPPVALRGRKITVCETEPKNDFRDVTRFVPTTTNKKS